MKTISYLVALTVVISCSRPQTDPVARYSKENQKETPVEVSASQPDSKYEELKAKVFALQGTIDQINAFVASDFANCVSGLPPFETKICQIAQTAVAEQQVLYSAPIQSMLKMFQTSLYGQDCVSTDTVGCPVVGSIMQQLQAAANYGSQISQLEADVASLENDMLAFENRLNDFNGTGSSIETVINGINSQLASIDSRIDSVEETINNGDVYRTYFLCSDNNDSGPVYEPILIPGNNILVNAYVRSANHNGMGVIAQAGVTGDVFGTTDANTKTCNFKIYDLTTTVKVCWHKSNRSASSALIDTVCDKANNFVGMTANCTCAN